LGLVEDLSNHCRDLVEDPVASSSKAPSNPRKTIFTSERIEEKIMHRNKKGFTLIEMLVVIAIIAVLVAIVIPTVTSATDKAKAAADASNLRSILGAMNAVLMTDERNIEQATMDYAAPDSALYSGAKLYVMYTIPGVIDVYYVDGENYYGLTYFSELALNGPESPALASISTAKPTPAIDHEWYEMGVGKVS